MGERLEDVVLAALRGKELDVDAHRVTAPDSFGVSQYRSIVKIDAGDRIAEAVLDFLVGEETARVSVDGLYKTTIPVSPILIEQDSFDVRYTLEPSETMPLTLIAVGENTAAVPERREEKEVKHKIPRTRHIDYAPIIPLAEAEGVVYLARLPDVAVVDRRMLRTMGIADEKAARHVAQAKEKGFSYYTLLDERKYRRFILVPKGAEEIFGKDIEIRAERFTGIDIVSKQGLEAYLTNRNVSLAPDVELSEMVFGGKTYYARAAVDSYTVSKEAKERASAPRPTRAPAPVPEPAPVVPSTKVEYTLEERGLVTVVKDVALLDRVELWSSTKIKSAGYAGIVLRARVQENGFADYITHTKTGSRKRVAIVPRGTEERIYAGLKLNTFADLELIAKENLGAYCREKESTEINAAKASVVTIKGKEYYLANQIDEMIGRGNNDTSEQQGKSERTLPKEKISPPRIDSLSGVVDVHHYRPKGVIEGNFYRYNGTVVPLFEGGAESLVKYGAVFHPFTSEELKGAERTSSQNTARRKILETTAAKDRRDEWGNKVPETEIGRGKKHYLPVPVANAVIMYLADNGFSNPNTSKP